MPEETVFWALAEVLHDYFDGYYTKDVGAAITLLQSLAGSTFEF
jgi:hypothetical protein